MQDGAVKTAFFAALNAVIVPSVQSAEIVNIHTGSSAVPIAIFLSAVIGAVTAIVSVAKHRITVQKQSAVKFATQLESDKCISEHFTKFKKLINEDKLLSILDDDADFADKKSVASFLNLMEILSVSVLQNVFDENVCKAILGDYLVKRWDEAEELILKVREIEESEVFFVSFQIIAERWRGNLELEQERYFPKIWEEIKRL